MGRTVQTVKSSDAVRAGQFGGKKKVMKAPKSGIKTLKTLNAAVKKTPAAIVVADAAAAADGKKERRRPRVGPSKVLSRLLAEERHPKPGFARAPFDRLIREIANNITQKDHRFSANAVNALLEGCKAYLISMFRQVSMMTYHDGGRVTTMPKDIRLWRAVVLDSHKIDPGAHTVMSAEFEKEQQMKARGCNYWTTNSRNYHKRLLKPVITSGNVETVRQLVGSIRSNNILTTDEEPVSPSLPALSDETSTVELSPPSPQKDDDLNELFED